MKVLIITIIILFLNVFGYSQNPDNKVTAETALIKINADPKSGFNFSYYIFVPKGVDQQSVNYLLVETNNSGSNDSIAHHEKEAELGATKNSLGSSIAKRLKTPFVFPAFPRPAKEWKLYTHALDRDSALTDDIEIKRLDLQLIAMIKDAKKHLLKLNIKTQDKILMNGFSASGTFANRFTLIHPEIVAGVACGGINAFPILPIKTLGKGALIYPLGTFDFEKIFNKKADLETYKKVPQFLYMGENDDNDAVLFDDAYSKKERAIIYKHIGKKMMPDRWTLAQNIYQKNNINAEFRTYKGIGHETNKTVFDDLINFYKKIILN